MKKVIAIIGAIVLVLGVAAAGFGFYYVHTPQHALAKTARDMKESGLDGLKPHVTGKAAVAVEAASAVANNSLVKTITGLLGSGENDYMNILESYADRMEWEVEEIEKHKETATATLSFDYDGKLTGTVDISMVKEDGEWLIESLSIPNFDKMDL